MTLKPGASLEGVQWQMFAAALKVEPLFESAGSECTITSGTDGKHMEGSLHYKGMALDFRTRDLIASLLLNLPRLCKHVLGSDYDVVLEKDHIHIEYQPKEHK